MGYEVRDLGPVTFSEAGTKTFQFAITGQNPNSSGYEFICDYLDLVPYFEAEGLPVGGTLRTIVTIHDRKPERRLMPHCLKATRPGDYVTYGVPIAEPGNYNVRVKTKTGSDHGIFQLFIDGVKQGYAQKQGSI